MASNLTTVEQVENIIGEVEAAFFDIPFDNSAFQTECFVIAAGITPERAYRSIGLRMSAKIRALQEAKFGRLKHQVDVEELEAKIGNGELNEFDKRRELIKIEKTEADIRYANKLINDAVTELDVLYKHFRALPKFTRAQFEAGEHRHFSERLKRQNHITSSETSLINMNEDINALLIFEEATVAIDQITDEHLKYLDEQLINIRENLKDHPPESPVRIGNGEHKDNRI